MNTFKSFATRTLRRSPCSHGAGDCRPDRGGADLPPRVGSGDERLDGRDLPGDPPRLQLSSLIPSPPTPRALAAGTDSEGHSALQES
jgi:hypothetical protein